MELKILRRIILFFSVLLPCAAFACGWEWDSETIRLALFRAERNHFLKLHPFCYNSKWYAEDIQLPTTDNKRNCEEWQKQLGSSVGVDDIYKILYETDPDFFQNAYETGMMTKTFPNNTFIKALSDHKNKAYLEYMIYAKKLEYNSTINGKWETWDKMDYGYYDVIPKKEAQVNGLNAKLLSTKDRFLKQRYAFLLLRHDFYSYDKANVMALYRQYFENKQASVLNIWAMYYMALCLDNKAETNYYLSKVFVAGNDKSFVSVRLYDESQVRPAMAFAQNDFEKGILLAMQCMRNPAPALEQLKEIQPYMPNSEYFSFLIQREVNKLEDWIFTPLYADEMPAVKPYSEEWYQDFDSARKVNYQKDIAYLHQLKSYLQQIYPKANQEQKDYLSAAIAQLCFIGDDIETGKKYTAMISKTANASIQLQKNIQLSLVMLHRDDITDPKIQQQLFDCFHAMENVAEQDHYYFKSMYTLYRIASFQYKKMGRNDLAGLFFHKSEERKTMGRYTDFYSPSYYYFYTYAGYFERYATLKDMDRMIGLIEKKDKTPFEQYLCTGAVSKDMNVYRDIKGTIAFRQNDLETAYAEFAKMPADFWDTHYEFRYYLNEDPFVPKALVNSHKRKFDYKFNKANFVAELIKLKKQNTAESNMKLAHAYFNLSYWGNSWMMNAYGWSSGDYTYSDYAFGGDRKKREEAYQSGNYYHCNLAKQYYLKALALSKNQEQKALANLMIFECEYYASLAGGVDSGLGYEAVFKPGRWIYDFHAQYAQTETYRKYTHNCSLLQSYLN